MNNEKNSEIEKFENSKEIPSPLLLMNSREGGPSQGGVYKAIQNVMKAIDAVGKEQRNQHQNFNFRGIDDVYNAVHSAMAEHGLFSIPRVLSHREQFGKTRAGGDNIRVMQEIIFRFYHTDGSFLDVGPIYGEAIDTGDKATNKSNSIAHKYALVMAFCIPTKDMDDPDVSSPELPGRGKQQQRPAPTAANRETKTKPPEAPPKSSDPQFDPGPPPQQDETWPEVYGSVEEAGQYLITIGRKYNGKRLYEVSPQELVNFSEWLKEDAEDKGRQLSTEARHFRNAVARYVALLDKK